MNIEETFSAFDRENNLVAGSAHLAFISTPEMVEKMSDYLERHGVTVKKSTAKDPVKLAILVKAKWDELRKKFRDQEKARHIGDKNSFDDFASTPLFKVGEDNFVSAQNEAVGLPASAENSHANFDNFAWGAVAKLGKKGLDKIKEGVKRRKERKAKEGEIAEKQNELSRMAVATPQGLPVNSLNGEDIVNRIKDSLKIGIEDYKKSEKAKEINKMTPWFIVGAIILLYLGYNFGRNA